MTTQQLLDMLRDARELGDAAFEQSVLEQLGVDVAYVEQACAASASTYRPRFDDDELDYDPEPETEEERRARVGLTARNIERRDWLAWMKSSAWWRYHEPEGTATNLTSLSEVYKRYYSEKLVSSLADRPHPLFATLKKSGSLL